MDGLEGGCWRRGLLECSGLRVRDEEPGGGDRGDAQDREEQDGGQDPAGVLGLVDEALDRGLTGGRFSEPVWGVSEQVWGVTLSQQETVQLIGP